MKISFFLAFALATAACHQSGNGDNSEDTLTACSDDIDNDGDGFVDCDDSQCLSFGICGQPDTDTDSDTDTDTDSDADADSDSDTTTDTDSGTDSDTGFVVETDTGIATGMIWVTLPGGSFEMGDTERPTRQPIHTVAISTFEINRTEITVAQYTECVEAGECTEARICDGCNWGDSGYEDHPINSVDMAQSRMFCEWAGGRLPTEAEWEYAARSGGREIRYPWGNEESSCGRAWMAEEADANGCGTFRTARVCSRPFGNTAHGLCDMAGNVYERVEDIYHDSYDCDATSEVTYCEGGGVAPSDGSAWITGGDERFHVCRGGCYTTDSPSQVVSARGMCYFTDAVSSTGLRCAR